MPQPILVEAGEFKRAAKSAVDTSNMVLVKTGTFGTKAVDEAARTVDFIISTAAEDRENDVISLSGWQLGNYRKNPVVLWAHSSRDLPVGKSLSETVDGSALRSTCQFATKDENPFADMVYRLVLGRFLNATSVGFRPIKWMWNEERDSWAIDYVEQELLEYSVVPVPANPEALIEARGKGIDTAPLIGWVERTLDGMGEGVPGLLIPRGTLEAARKAAGAKDVTVFPPLKFDAAGRPVQTPEFRAAFDAWISGVKADKAADGQGERFLLPMTAETSYPPFPWDATFLARMRPDQAPHYYAALTGAASLPRQSFKLADLTATQNRVDTAKVQAMRGGSAQRSAAPVVVRMGGRLYIADGHHGLSAAWLDGADTFECGFKDLDAVTDGLQQTSGDGTFTCCGACETPDACMAAGNCSKPGEDGDAGSAGKAAHAGAAKSGRVLSATNETTLTEAQAAAAQAAEKIGGVLAQCQTDDGKGGAPGLNKSLAKAQLDLLRLREPA